MTTTAADAPTVPRRWGLTTPLRPAAWRAYLYFLAISALALIAVVYVFGAGFTSGLLFVTLIGIPLLAGVVLSGRLWNQLYRSLARLLGVTIDAPAPFVRPSGWFMTLRAALTDAVGWRSLGFLTIQALLVLPIGFFVLIGVVAAAILVVSPVVWLVFGEPLVSLGEPVESLGAYLLLSLAGIAALYVLGWLMLGLCRAHVWLVQALLGPTQRERRVAQLARARAEVVDDSAVTLRRVERDLHDGTQARLITVAMSLARADEHLATSDTARARALVADALAETKYTLTELRDLVRGIRPPALDLGLGPAIQTLCARQPIPVELAVELPVRPSIGVETMAYFCVAELLANVSRHSGASHAAVRVGSDSEELRIVVEDNGSGGVQVGNGSGLTGLRDRLAMLDGRLDVDSPAGGPTVITVEVPTGVPQ